MSAAMEQPKRIAGGAFGRFLATNRQKLMAEVKGQPITAVTKLASTRWKALPPAEVAPYQKMYEAAKKKYEEDMAAFTAGGGVAAARKRKGGGSDDEGGGKKAKKDANAPKRPTGGGYGSFLAAKRPEFALATKGQGVAAVAKMAGEKWKALSAADKKPFEEEYAKKKAAYDEAMKSYVPPAKPEPVAKEAAAEKEEEEEDEDEDDEDEEEEDDEEDEEEGKKKPKAKAKAAGKAASSPVKAKAKVEVKASARASVSPKAAAKGKAKAAAKVEAKVAPVVLEAAVKAKAEKAGCANVLIKLLTMPEIKATKKSQAVVLKALEGASGLLHPAKKAILG